ncbi:MULTISPECIES: phosphoribosyltransferase [unclassified Paenibacillus]|uniref:phosphoribosyltransferase n=1 Tax=unclassified Paenibacillus TaxID=185978 RepID=UPI00064AD015|nr:MULTISPECIES: phosphoribosyltransferase [unclassified Paenibacillus]KLU58238.1 hypothetical protein EL84_00265 [Paenibacillus sp. VT-400]QZN77689.1 phosphoribosyltransferase [Paenibacillus sp. DR312]
MIEKLDWNTFESYAQDLSNHLCDKEIDLIVGASRGGLPLAVFLSHHLQCRDFGIVHIKKTASDHEFSVKRDSKLEVIGSIFPPIKPKNILLVDDIVTYGDLFSTIHQLVYQEYGEDIQVYYATLFSDRKQIQEGIFSNVLDNLHSSKDIDNTTNWIVFPWERND